MNIVFFGTPEVSCSVLEKILAEKNITVKAVVTNPDAPVGRKQVITPSPIKMLAEKYHIPVLTPSSASDPDFLETLKSYAADLFIVVSYGKILPQTLLDIPKKGAYNLHFSLLPKYRGASPVQAAIVNGDICSGITIFRIVPALDAGDIVVQIPHNIAHKTTAQCLQEMSQVGGKAMVEFITHYNAYPHIPQDKTKATFCKKIEKQDGEIIPQKMTASEIYQKFLAYTPWPGLYSFLEDGKRIKWTKLEPVEKIKTFNVGEMWEEGAEVFLQTYSGVLKVITIQLEGKTQSPARKLKIKNYP